MKILKFSTLLFCLSMLFIACEEEDAASTAKEEAKEQGTLLVFEDVEFAQSSESETYGRFFSISEGKTLKYSEIDDVKGPLVDIAFKGSTSTFIFFESPDQLFDKNEIISGAKSTKVHNYDNGFDDKEFDAATNGVDLDTVNVINDRNSIGTLDFPYVVTFETQEGKKGVIKLKAINSERLVADIKVQK